MLSEILGTGEVFQKGYSEEIVSTTKQSLLATDTIPHIENYTNKPILFLQDVVRTVFRLLKKTNTSDAWLRTKKYRQTLVDLLQEGETSFMNPCFEYTALTAKILEDTGAEDIEFVVFVLEGGVFHFGLQCSLQHTPYFIDYTHQNNIKIGEGKAQNPYDGTLLGKKSLPVQHTLYLPIHILGRDTSLMSLAKSYSFPEKVIIQRISELIRDNKNGKEGHNRHIRTIQMQPHVPVFLTTQEPEYRYDFEEDRSHIPEER